MLQRTGYAHAPHHRGKLASFPPGNRLISLQTKTLTKTNDRNTQRHTERHTERHTCTHERADITSGLNAVTTYVTPARLPKQYTSSATASCGKLPTTDCEAAEALYLQTNQWHARRQQAMQHRATQIRRRARRRAAPAPALAPAPAPAPVAPVAAAAAPPPPTAAAAAAAAAVAVAAIFWMFTAHSLDGSAGTTTAEAPATQMSKTTTSQADQRDLHQQKRTRKGRGNNRQTNYHTLHYSATAAAHLTHQPHVRRHRLRARRVS